MHESGPSQIKAVTMENLWWLWMLVAAAFFVAEILTAGFFMLWFGIGAAISGLLALIGLGWLWQLVVFIVISIVLFALTRQFGNAITRKQPPGIGADRFLQGQGVVFEEIDPVRGTGRIRIGGDEWRAGSADGETIPVDTIVTVVRVEGTRLMCRPETNQPVSDAATDADTHTG